MLLGWLAGAFGEEFLGDVGDRVHFCLMDRWRTIEAIMSERIPVGVCLDGRLDVVDDDEDGGDGGGDV